MEFDAIGRRGLAAGRDGLLALAERNPEPALRRSSLEIVPENARTLALALARGSASPPDLRGRRSPRHQSVDSRSKDERL